jgi:predicted Zn-dependent protease
MRYVRARQKVVDDPLIDAYLADLGRDMVEASEAPGTPFHFFLIESPQINAFAGPGGYIGFNSGLLLTTDSENELAAVMAHEMSHVTQRHLVRAFDNAASMSLAQGALLIGAIILGATVGGQAGIAAAAGAQAAALQQQINFTRANEQEADRVGMALLAEAGFVPSAMPAFFERMGRANQLYATKVPVFLRTHPVTTSRIADATGRAEQYPYRHRPDSLGYLLTRAALRRGG